jgi:general stress protein 26
MTKYRELTDAMWETLDDSPFVMVSLDGVDQSHAQPMTAQIDEDFQNKFYFFSNKQNRLVDGLSQSNQCVVNIVGKGHGLFACVHGQLAIDTDRAIVDKLWSPIAATWYEHGKEDPDLVLLRFDLAHAEIWNASTGSFLKQLVAGLVLGSADEVSQDEVVKVTF